ASPERPLDVADVGRDPDRALRARLPRVRALPGELRAVARAAPGELPDALRGPGVLPHRGEHGGVPAGRREPEDGARAFPLGLLRARAALDPLALGDLHHSLGGAGDPDDLLDPLHAESRV